MNTNEILENEASNQATRRPAFLNWVKRRLAASIGAVLAVSATLSAHALPIKNGGFESGDLTDWVTTVAFDGGVTSAQAYSGSYSLELDAMDFVYQDLTTLKRFESLTFKAKAASYASTAYAWVYYQDGSSSSIEFSGLLSSSYWTAVGLALDSTKRVARVSFGLGESNPIYIDNVALIGP